jgi:transcriptional regulator
MPKDILGMKDKRPELVQGTLDLLVLNTLRHGPLHGYGIAQKILVTSQNVLEVQQGSLYPALHRLERKTLVTSEWKESGKGRMAKVYELTAAGKKQLEMEVKDWKLYTDAIWSVLDH